MHAPARLAALLAASALLPRAAAAPGATEACCWCDQDTPPTLTTILDSDGVEHELIFSDEFNVPGRRFDNGLDKRWTAVNMSDDTNASPMYYTPDALTTVKDRGAMVRSNAANRSDFSREWRGYEAPVGALRIKTENITGTPLHNETDKSFSGGMLQSWNKFCFTGGVIEISAKFPLGMGFWPALWLFGNLGRAIYVKSNDGLWPYSYSECDEVYEAVGTPPPGLPQRISGCNATPGEGLHPYQGRGATEIDIVEVGNSATGVNGWIVCSLQVSPSIPNFFRPGMGAWPRGYYEGDDNLFHQAKPSYMEGATWYRGLRFGGNQSGLPHVGPNMNWYGPPYADAVSGGISPLDDLSERYYTFRLEWAAGSGGHIRWFIDGVFAFEIPDEALGQYTVCGQRPGEEGFTCEHTPRRQMPTEPMSIVLNSALGSWNGGPEAVRGHLPGRMYVDYVRVWQRPDRRNTGCDPPDFPTKEYIEAHPELYGEAVYPPGDESCPGVYPPRSSKDAPPSAAPSPPPGSFGPRGPHEGHDHGRPPLDAVIIGGIAAGLAAISVAVLFGAVLAYVVRSRRARRSQYSSVGADAAAPMLGADERKADARGARGSGSKAAK